MPDRIRVSALILRGESVALVVFHTAELGEHFDLPGGGLEAGESLHEGVRRECYEELGCTVRVGRLLGVAEHLPDSLRFSPRRGEDAKIYILPSRTSRTSRTSRLRGSNSENLRESEHLPEPSPHDHYEGQHVLDFIFECVLEEGQEINLPTVHDEDQVGVAWRPIADLYRAALKPAAANWLLKRAHDAQDDLYQQNIWGHL